MTPRKELETDQVCFALPKRRCWDTLLVQYVLFGMCSVFCLAAHLAYPGLPISVCRWQDISFLSPQAIENCCVHKDRFLSTPGQTILANARVPQALQEFIATSLKKDPTFSTNIPSVASVTLFLHNFETSRLPTKPPEVVFFSIKVDNYRDH